MRGNLAPTHSVRGWTGEHQINDSKQKAEWKSQVVLRPRSSSSATPSQVPGDDRTLNLRCSLPDLTYLGVPNMRSTGYSLV